MILDLRGSPGFFFGQEKENSGEKYIGIPQGLDGNILIIGGNGSGKSSAIVKPTLQTWQGPICVTDIKGELSDHYIQLTQQGVVTRPYIIFDPRQTGGLGYDPFYWLEEDDELNLVLNIQKIVLTFIPIMPNDIQPFWVETERGICAAALLHYFRAGLSFSEVIALITALSLTELIKHLMADGSDEVKRFLGELGNAKPEMLANLDRGLRNKLLPFAVDPYISHLFRGKREGADCFTWADLDHYNIFLRIPADRIEQWGSAINLMYTQLIQHLERKPDKYSPEGRNTKQTLLLMDEFARFGKLDVLTDAVATLRCKGVNICLVAQSIAQLDKIYGVYDRRIIFDNCQFQAILRVNDAETQKYCSELIGTTRGILHSFGETTEDYSLHTSSSEQWSETIEWTVPPHKLSSLKDILLLTPYGFLRVEKNQLGNNVSLSPKSDRPRVRCFITKNGPQTDSGKNFIHSKDSNNSSLNNNGGNIKMLTINKRTQNAKEKIERENRQIRLNQQAEIKDRQKKDRRRNFIIGSLVSKYFPEVLEIDPGNETTWISENFKALEAFLFVLSSDNELVDQIKEKATYSTLTNNQSRGNLSLDSAECVSGRQPNSESACVRKGGDECG